MLLDGLLVVEVNGEAVVELGPGSILEERALIEEGNRTSTLPAKIKAKIAVAGALDIEAAMLDELAQGHRREHMAWRPCCRRVERDAGDASRYSVVVTRPTVPRFLSVLGDMV